MVQLLHDHATMPRRGSQKAAGFDVTACESIVIPAGERRSIPTGVDIACPKGSYARVAPRSGLSIKNSLDIGAGVIDADYRGEVKVVLVNNRKQDYHVETGARIAQIIIEKVS